MHTGTTGTLMALTMAVAAAASPSGVPSKAELETAITAARSQFPAFRIVCSVERQWPSSAVQRQAWRDDIAWNGTAFRVDGRYESTGATGSRVAADSRLAFGNGVAVYSSGPTGRIATKVQAAGAARTMYQHYLRWYFLDETDGSKSPQDLLAIVKAADTQVLPEPADVDGHPCIVLERRDGNGSAFERIWIDPGVSYMPRRHAVIGGGVEVAAWHLSNFVEIAPGCFLPAAGGQTCAPQPNAPDAATAAGGTVETMALLPLGAANGAFVATGGPAPDVAGAMIFQEGALVEEVETGATWVAAADGKPPAQ